LVKAKFVENRGNRIDVKGAGPGLVPARGRGKDHGPPGLTGEHPDGKGRGRGKLTKFLR